jgi:hypothetical protein
VIIVSTIATLLNVWLWNLMKMEKQAMEPKYPDITVQLTGEDGNAFAIMGACRKAMRRARLPDEEIEAFTKEMTAGDYDNLLQTAMKWLDVN